MNNKNFLIYILLIFTFFSCKPKTEEAQKTVLRPVKYAEITEGHSSNTNEFSGVAQSGKTSNLSFRVSGNIVRLNIKEGDLVKRGQRIASIDPTDYGVQLEQAQANLKSAEVQYKGVQSQVEVALSTYKRIETLYENNSVSLSEFEQAKTNYENAKAQLDASQAQIDAARSSVNAAKNQVSYAYLNAPFSGVIQQVNVDVNELIAAGNPICVLSAQGDPEVVVGIPEVYISQIKKRQNVVVSFSVLENQTFKGSISEIGFNLQNSATYPVTIKLLDSKVPIRPGMAAKVKFNFNPEEVGKHHHKHYPMAPANAVGEDNNGKFVFVLKDSGNKTAIVTKQTIEIGKLTNLGFEVVKGLQGGELVATAGLKSLLDGMEVKLLEQ